MSIGGYGGHTADGNGYSGTFVAPSFGGGSTDLASRLAAPRDPSRIFSIWIVPGLFTLGYGVAFALMAMQVFTSQLQEVIQFYGVASVFLLVVSGLCWWKFGQHVQELGEEKALYADRMQRWLALYYCGRCDSVYDPATGRCASSHNMRSLLD